MRSVTKSHYNLREREKEKKTSYQWTTGSDHHHQRGVSAWRKKLQDKEEGRRGEKTKLPKIFCVCMRALWREERTKVSRGDRERETEYETGWRKS